MRADAPTSLTSVHEGFFKQQRNRGLQEGNSEITNADAGVRQAVHEVVGPYGEDPAKVTHGVCYNAEKGSAKGDTHARARSGIIHTIDRIDDPRRIVCEVVLALVRLFGNKQVVGIFLLDAADDERLAGLVGFRDAVRGTALGHHGFRPIVDVREDQLTSLFRQRRRKIED